MGIGKLHHSIGLKTKIMAATTVVIVLTTITGSGFFYARTKAILMENLQERGKTICENLSYSAKYSVLTEDTVALNELAAGVMWAEDIVYVIIQNEKGKTLAEKTSAKLPDMPELKKKATASQQHEVSFSKDTFGNPIFNFSYPIIAKKVSIGEIGGVESALEEEKAPRTRGTIRVGLSLVNITKRLQSILRGIIVLVLIIIGLGIGFSIGFSKIIMRPIRKMADAAVKVASGDLAQAVEVSSEDEIGRFAQQFNTMTAALKKREEQLKESYKELSISEERYRVFVQNSSEGIWCFEPREGGPYPADTSKEEMTDWIFAHSILVECNDAMAKSHGFKKREDVLRLPITEFMPKSDPENVKSIRSFICNGYQLLDVEVQKTNAEGDTHVMLNNLVGITKDGRLLRVWGIQQDVTEIKRAEQLQMQLFSQIKQANQELKEFAYVASHDLKAPLRGIRTLAEWIVSDYSDKLDETGKERLNLLLSRVARMHNLIDGILQYSRVGRVKEKQVLVNLNELIPEIIDILAPPENIKITIENELPVLKCEQVRITQVFQNLLSNAIKYMDKPEGLIQIGCTEEKGYWKFSIADNGPGIEEKHFEKIFQIFQTLSRRDDLESTGIGLTLVKKIVELYDGKVWVESKVGQGSTFFFTFPKQKTEVVKDEELQANFIG